MITGVGGKVLGVGIMTGGLRYAANGGAGTEFDTYPISTKGTGLKLKIVVLIQLLEMLLIYQ